MATIIHAEEPAHINAFIELAHEYITWSGLAIEANYPDLDISTFMQKHAYDDLHAKFPGEHVFPDGCLLLALDGEQAWGCIALGRLTSTICEMRTMYVHPKYRGQGIGRQLTEAVIQESQQLGYAKMRLDTLAFMNSALGLYQSLGFRPIEPYREMPPAMVKYIRFLELDL